MKISSNSPKSILNVQSSPSLDVSAEVVPEILFSISGHCRLSLAARPALLP